MDFLHPQDYSSVSGKEVQAVNTVRKTPTFISTLGFSVSHGLGVNMI